MNRFFKPLVAASALCVATCLVGISPAAAQATRTWVSGVGDDANPCSRTAPCKTFAGAISKTATGGEINCLDPGGFGTVTITKSITIDCTGTLGSSLNSGSHGFTINDGTGAANVILRGLTINGAGGGFNGIRFYAGSSLIVEDVIIQNEDGGAGVLVAPSANTPRVSLSGVTIADGNIGVLVQPTGSGSARLDIRNSRVKNNSGAGVRLDTSGTSSNLGIIALVESSEVSGNSDGVSLNVTVATRPAIALVVNSVVSNNTGIGVFGNGPAALARVSGTTITGNNGGVNASGGSAVLSYGDNRLVGNNVDGAFTPPVLSKN